MCMRLFSSWQLWVKGDRISGKKIFFAWTKNRYLLISLDSQKKMQYHVYVIMCYNKHLLHDRLSQGLSNFAKVVMIENMIQTPQELN